MENQTSACRSFNFGGLPKHRPMSKPKRLTIPKVHHKVMEEAKGKYF